MKRLFIAANLLMTASFLSAAGSLTITAPAASSVGGSSPQWQYNQSGTVAGVAPVSFNVSAITLSSTHTIVLASATVTGSTYTLPSASNTGQILQIVKVNVSTYPVTILAAGTDLISGTTRSLVLNAVGQTDELIADGISTWWPHGQGIEPTPPRLYSTPFQGAAGFVVGASSNIAVCPLYVPIPVTVTGFAYDCGVTGSANVAFGIFDKNGTVVVSTGPLLLVAGAQALLMTTPVSLAPGEYNLAIQLSNTTGQVQGGGETNSGWMGCSQTTEAAMGIVNITLPGGSSSTNAPGIAVLLSGGRQTYK